MRKKEWIVPALSIASSLVLSVNSLVMNSPIIGIVASVLFISVSGIVLGGLFYPRENSFFRMVLGFATFLLVLALVGSVLILLASFQKISSSVVIILIGAVLSAMFLRFGKGMRQGGYGASPKGPEVDKKSFLLGLPFLVFTVISFRMLWLSRTGEGVSSVWLTIPNLFPIVFFFTSLSLAVFVFFARTSIELKLALICLYSFLSHSLFLLVWYPGRYGDPWAHLGETRYIVGTGMPTAYDYMLQNLDRLIVDFIKFRTQHSLVAFFTRMFSVDIYWVHILLVPVLWSVFSPLLAYKLSETLATKKSKVIPLLTAMVTGIYPTLIAWGTVSVPNSLGFIFFFLSTTLLVLWINGAGRQMWFLALMASTVSFLAHPQPGIFAFMFFLFGSIIQKTSRNILRIASYPLIFAVYPLSLYFRDASFSLDRLFVVGNFLFFQSEISTILLIFGLVGLVLGIRGKYVSVRASCMFFVFYVTILFEYYFTNFGMANLPFGSRRILVLADFLLVPFVALGLLIVVDTLRRTFSRGKTSVSLSLSSRRVGIIVNSKFLALLLISLFLSFQATSVLYQAYPSKELLDVQPSAYELDAIRYIDSDASGRYVVLCEPSFAWLAIGFLGSGYAYIGSDRGVFGPGDWDYETVEMYLAMTRQPAVSYMQQAMEFASADVSYFVVSVRNPDFEEVVERTLEVLHVNEIFGDEKLYVFKYPLPIVEKLGPTVKVIYDNGLGIEYVQTKLVYMVESEVNSTLTYSGYTSYNVTEFPAHWAFLDLTVNNVSKRFDESSDINTFVYVRDLEPSDVLTLKWRLNLNYPEVSWKEDSFKREWRSHPKYGGDPSKPPIITTDGNVLLLSYSFEFGEYWYYYYVTSVDVLTDDHSYLLMRWKSNLPVAVAYAYFEFEFDWAEEIISFGSRSLDWTTTVVKLPSGVALTNVMIGLSNARYSPSYTLFDTATMEVDFILIASKATP